MKFLNKTPEIADFFRDLARARLQNSSEPPKATVPVIIAANILEAHGLAPVLGNLLELQLTPRLQLIGMTTAGPLR